ncbi:ABC transporter permease [Clostridium butyricum]|uniref:Nickel ABC transporter permease subunit NikC n=1 Tax=Clostridium butyricum TaxID=1492 RepID=A0A2S7F9Z9_CLOBU|nr:ABC transporter permease [Clostridium butyricum]EMU54357.1 inner membrane ABC transporter permease protein YddQ [Clostridium butyricum DKU-01]KHD16615.1 nickel transporter permease NikC [Clostridium butyricum]MDB2150676.1 ABC transporter permease [Clostridium butyricum]PPV14208.1 nickel ABC transporter permease subunit NikC [Clostridium butyricum]
MLTKDKKISVDLKFKIILIILVLIIIVGIMSPIVAPNDPYKTDFFNTLKSPSIEFWFGTDALGRCIFSRVLYGISNSIISALTVVLITFSVGTIIGVISGFYGGILDEVIMGIVDVFLSFPGIIIAVAVAGILGGGIKNAMIAIGLISWPKYSRLARCEVMAINSETFILAAKLSGNGNLKIILKHIIPNIIGALVITASADVGIMIMELAGLSFLGLSSPLPIPEWGSMMNEGKSMLQSAPWITLFPGTAILIVVILFNLLGDTICELLENGQRRQVK